MMLDCLQKAKVYEQFDVFLFDLGILTDTIGYYDANYIDITVKYIRDLNNYRQLLNTHKESLTEVFIKLWQKQGGVIHLEQYNNPNCFFFNVNSIQARYMTQIVGDSRKELYGAICRHLPSGVTPKYFFLHSCNCEHGICPAGCRVIFALSETLEELDSVTRDSIYAECASILMQHDKYNMFESDYFVLSYYDLTTCGDDLYGMSRED